MPIPLLIATNNRNKLREFRALFDGQFQVVSPGDLGLTLAVEETGTTFAQNASLKARHFCRASGLTSLADDSGLVVDALNGDPGVYSARFGGPGKTDAERVRLVLELMSDVPPPARTARFVACIAIATPAGALHLAEASVDGTIARQPRGERGFGYDPIFVFPPAARTFAQMTAEEKNRISHRARAAALAQDILRSLERDDIL